MRLFKTDYDKRIDDEQQERYIKERRKHNE